MLGDETVTVVNAVTVEVVIRMLEILNGMQESNFFLNRGGPYVEDYWDALVQAKHDVTKKEDK